MSVVNQMYLAVKINLFRLIVFCFPLIIFSMGCSQAGCVFSSLGSYEAFFDGYPGQYGACVEANLSDMFNAQVYQDTNERYGAIITLPTNYDFVRTYDFGSSEDQASMIIMDSQESCSQWKGTAAWASLPPNWNILVSATCLNQPSSAWGTTPIQAEFYGSF